ncbi:cation:dicarboxylase symporter family transporter, partial [Pseudoalteromonas sp. S1649]|uniref:cation:dicarboxylate symporter family transporter n=1 Tax=Pseudoalteromonas sp. S1649 TaxID=579508 RepID=UPI00110A1F95
KRLASVVEDLNTLILTLETLLMNSAPYGVFVYIAKLFTTIDLKLITSWALYFGVVVFALLFHGFVNYSLLLKLFTGLNPITFLKKRKTACVFGFSTSSSSAPLQITHESATKTLG